MTRSVGVLIFLALSHSLVAQGTTTAAIQGMVLRQGNAPITGATVRVINTSTGRRWEISTTSTGRYALEDVAIGGPYTIDVRALGYTPEVRAGIVVVLGQRVIEDFLLEPTAIELTPVTITATAHPILNPGRTGPAEIISAERIATLPNFGRDLLSVTLLSPQVAFSPSARFANTEGVTFAGQSRLLNGFQIDGGESHDLYSGRLQPGLQTWPRPISLEAVEEIQVLVAPIDVRYGGFAGGLLNTVTKTGTNTVRGSLFSLLSQSGLVGRNSTDAAIGDFTAAQFGGAIGGPIIHDRLHYFLSADIYKRSIADSGPLIADTAGSADLAKVGVRYTSALRFQDILRNTYGLDPGTLGPYQASAPSTDVFGKISLEVATNSHLELSHHYTHGERKTYIVRQFGVYFLSSVGTHQPATGNATRLVWSSVLRNGWSNELMASYLRNSEACRPNVPYALINVNVDRGRLSAGTTTTCPQWAAHNGFEASENLTLGLGAHLLTLGAHLEVLHFDDGLKSAAALWNFGTLDALAAGTASHYEATIPGPSPRHGIAFRAHEFGFYAQDRWHPARAITLTSGLRVDVPSLPDRVDANQSLATSLNIDNTHLPTGDILWSPRLGINYDIGGEGHTFVRAGIGLFNGRPAYSWVGSPYRDNGLKQLFLTCDGTAVPHFDPANKPTTCATGTGPTPRLSFLDGDLKFPQSLKAFTGIDRRLPLDIVGTLDFLYTRSQHQFYFDDANLSAPIGTAVGEGGRALYGTISPSSGSPTPTRLAPVGQVVRGSNRSGDHTVSLAVQARKQFGDRAEVSGLYAHTRAWDRMSIVNNLPRPNLETTPLDGLLTDRHLTTSLFEIPHRIEASATMRLPYLIGLSLRYSGSSGIPYTYTIRGDANADGIGNGTMTNDIVYVPRDRSDISIDGNGGAAGFGTAANQDSVYDNVIDPFIRKDPCLRSQRGRILGRNSCRNPWFGSLNARLTKAFPTMQGQSLELSADVYNVLNMLNRNWGQYRVTTLDPSATLLLLAGYDATNGRGVYRDFLPGFRQIQDLASRWQMELGARYKF